MSSMKLAIKRQIVRMICMRPIAELLFRWHRGLIPFRGMVFDTSPSDVPRSMVPRLYWKLYERAEVDFVAQYLRPELPAIELGSCVGVVACCIAKKQHPDSKLISVEANPRLRQTILDNIERNVPGKEVDVVTGAIDYSGAKTVNFSIAGDAVSSRVEHDGPTPQDSDNMANLPAIQLRSLLFDHQIEGHYALICDIESAEAGLILADSEGLSHCQQLIIELHPGTYGPWNTSLDELVEALISQGFRLAQRRGDVCLFDREPNSTKA